MIYIISIIISLILAFLANKLLFVGSGLTLIPWALAGLILGFFTTSRRQSLTIGAIYGFLLSFSFLIFGYSGARSLITVLPFFFLLGLIGLVCGAILSFLGNLIRSKIKPTTTPPQ